MKASYKNTVYASYLDYIVQGIVNNVSPILFIFYQEYLGISVDKIGLLIAINFGFQILVDILASRYAERIGIRKCMLGANIFAIIGLIGISVTPFIFANTFIGLVLFTIINAIGGGLIEVLVSPIIEGIPEGNRDKRMSILHSFYCWGCVGFIAISTLVLKLVGDANWQIVPVLWVFVPVIAGVMFIKAPIIFASEDRSNKVSIKEMAKTKLFWSFCILMLCAGAAEMAMSQWSSYFCEVGLKVDKTLGDLLGPCLFSVLMGVSRVFYGKSGDKIKLEKVMVLSCILCVASYLLTVIAPHPYVGLLGCALCGLSVGLFWPGTYSLAAKSYKTNSSTFFGILALFGDLGCTTGPQVVSVVSEFVPDLGLKAGMAAAVVFPVVLGGILLVMKKNKKM